MAKKPEVKESAEYDNFLEESKKPLEKVDLTALLGAEEEKTAHEKAEESDKWENHWMDMPEFEQEDDTPFKKITVSFRTQEDYEEFVELVKQTNMTLKTKSIWYPSLAKDANCLKRWFE